jgi:hypothetical protein
VLDLKNLPTCRLSDPNPTYAGQNYECQPGGACLVWQNAGAGLALSLLRELSNSVAQCLSSESLTGFAR